MRREILLFFGAAMGILILGCAGRNAPVQTPASTATELSVIVPYGAQTSRPQPTRTAPPVADISTPVAYPRWVMEFADPILRSLEFQRPIFEDNFPPVCIDEGAKTWKVCANPEPRLNYQYPLSSLPTARPRPTLDLQPDLQLGYALRNTGWFYDVPGSVKNPHFARVDSGVLVLNLPNGNERRDFSVYHRYFTYKNFVVQFDVEFLQTEPGDTFRFQFQQPDGGIFALDLTKHKNWKFQWGKGADIQSREGLYYYLELAQVRVLMIASGTTCAVYLNNTPVDLFENCRADLNNKVKAKDITFHLLSEPLHKSVVTMDNVLLWDLDSIP